MHVDTKSASAMFEVLRSKLNHTAAFPHFMSVLQHCILLPREENQTILISALVVNIIISMI